MATQGEKKGKILWVDDEIELLRPHILFLESKGFAVTPVANAEDGIELIRRQEFDLVLLDEMLNGMDGLSALSRMKELRPSLPVVMVTKSEEESLMEEAIGAKISDYLTKPVNPSQILLICKKLLEGRKIESARLSRDYVAEFAQIAAAIASSPDWREWISLHVRLSQWEVELDQHPDLGLRQTLADQRRTCNIEFGRFVETHYPAWMRDGDGPPLSVDVVSTFLAPLLKVGRNTVFMVIDNLRLDQWLTLEPMLYPYFNVTTDYYYSILPTATPYSRNAIFSGLFPIELGRLFPDFWQKGQDDEQSQNRNERQLLDQQLARLGVRLRSEAKYIKVLDLEEARNVEKNARSLGGLPLVSIVVNFVDILAHSRSDSEVLKEITVDEPAYRSLTKSWFEHSHLFRTLQELAAAGATVVLTSDHGSIRVARGAKVIGDRETSTNLRYKFGKSLKADPKNAIIVRNPAAFNLPPRGLNTDYLIAKEDFYFVYPTNYHHYLSYYRDSLQHGGASMEEMILPVVRLEPK
ncbi:MAG: PglZ domain-containing protein [bacterium]|nr:PglZ domain-containing protein [candidate division KSB1 bacterium]MDH7559067.1 PglZ domain-containing protein [bacterium]